MTTITGIKTDQEICAELGGRLQQYRLQQNLTVEQVATKSGLNRNTIQNAEKGANPRLVTTIKLLRALDRLEALEGFLPQPTLSPLALLERKGKPRRRARPRRNA